MCIFVNFQLGSYSETIEDMSGRNQDRLGPERNTLGRSVKHPEIYNIGILINGICSYIQ
jgi:hypothetical protein